MARPRIVLVYSLMDPTWEKMLVEKGELIRPAGDDAASIRAVIESADAILLSGPARLTAELIDAAPRLKVIGATGSGTDNTDVEAATRRRIPVIHGAGAAPRAVAEYALAAMVAAHRGFLGLHNRLNAGPMDWVKERTTRLRGTELSGTTLGIIGLGNIGKTLARMARAAFDMKVLAYDPYITPESFAGLAERVSDIGALLDASMTVSVHVPLNATTRGLLRREHFRRIGPGGVLVNASRGGVMDEGELAAALHAGELKGAVIDVFDNEPPNAAQIARLSGAPNVLLTPHVAGCTTEAFTALSRNVVEGVIAVLEGRRPARVANPQVLD